MTLDTRLIPPKQSFKERYAKDWVYSVMCEATAFINLKQLFSIKNSDILKLGKGVMSTDLILDPTSSPPDFYIPKLNLFVEVSSSKLSQFESYCRCMKLKDIYDHPLPPLPHLFVRQGKVEDAREQRRLLRTVFASVNPADGSILYIGSNVRDFPLTPEYEAGGEPYYAVPWGKEWMKPEGLRAWAMKREGGK